MANLLVRDSAGNVKELKADGAGTSVDPHIPVQNVRETGPIRPAFFLRLIDPLNADSDDMAVDGSATPVTYSRGPAAGVKWRIGEIIFHIVDGAAMTTSKFGNQAELTVGITPELLINSTPIPLIEFPIKSNSTLASVSGNFNHLSIGSGDETITSIVDFTKSGQMLRLDGDTGDKFQLTINDNLSTMTGLHLILVGYVE